MSVTKEEVSHVAKLAKLQLSEKEIAEYTEQFNDVLDYMKVLDQAETEMVAETNQVTGLKNVMREDLPEDYPEEGRKKLLREVPVVKEGYVVVPDTIS